MSHLQDETWEWESKKNSANRKYSKVYVSVAVKKYFFYIFFLSTDIIKFLGKGSDTETITTVNSYLPDVRSMLREAS